jgi:hypothetical protein
MPAPTVEQATTYLGADSSWTEEQVSSAFAAEKAAQAKVCRVPVASETPETDPDWDADLVEALFRRVAHNLALRALPLGLQATITDGAALANQVGGTDAEVRRLEKPFRKLVFG